MPAATTVTSALWIYWRGLYLCLVRHGEYGELRTLTDSKRARLQIYMLALSFRLWHQKHYRSGTFQNDMQKNLCNVAVPKTGLPLSALTCVDTYVPGPPYCTYELRVPASRVPYVPKAQGSLPRYVRRTRTSLGRAARTAYRGAPQVVCGSRVVAAVFLFTLYPLLCAVGALVRARLDGVAFGPAFGTQLLEPEDWFALWRPRCAVKKQPSLVHEHRAERTLRGALTWLTPHGLVKRAP